MASVGLISSSSVALVADAIYANTITTRIVVSLSFLDFEPTTNVVYTATPTDRVTTGRLDLLVSDLLVLEPVDNIVFSAKPTNRGTLSADGIMSDLGGAGSNVRQLWN